MWIVKYPFAASGAFLGISAAGLGNSCRRLALGRGSLPDLAGELGTGSPEVPQKVVEMIGGLREIGIMTPAGKVSNRYEDMVALARQVEEAPNGVAFMASGWLFEGHDTYFPEYLPDSRSRRGAGLWWMPSTRSTTSVSA